MSVFQCKLKYLSLLMESRCRNSNWQTPFSTTFFDIDSALCGLSSVGNAVWMSMSDISVTSILWHCRMTGMKTCTHHELLYCISPNLLQSAAKNEFQSTKTTYLNLICCHHFNNVKWLHRVHYRSRMVAANLFGFPPFCIWAILVAGDGRLKVPTPTVKRSWNKDGESNSQTFRDTEGNDLQ